MKILPEWFLNFYAAKGTFARLKAIADARTAADAPSTAADRFLRLFDDGVAFDAPQRLKAPSWLTSEAGLKQHDRADWQHTDPRIRLFAAKLVEAARRQDIPLYVHCAFRTKAEQAAMLAKGVSRVRWPRASHCQGKAVDIVHARYHWELTRQEWRLLGVIGKEVARKMNIEVTWGGDWNFYDPAHWELSGWKANIKLLESGSPIRKTPRKILTEMQGMQFKKT